MTGTMQGLSEFHPFEIVIIDFFLNFEWVSGGSKYFLLETFISS